MYTSYKVASVFTKNFETVTNYSGRWMYGSECLAVKCESVNLFVSLFLEEAANEYKDYEFEEVVLEFSNMLRCMRTDFLGSGMIVYFPYYNLL